MVKLHLFDFLCGFVGDLLHYKSPTNPQQVHNRSTTDPQQISQMEFQHKAFHTRGPAAEKLLLLKLLYVRGTTHILSDADPS